MSAIFDPTGTYRYTLWRGWSDAPRLAFVLLNPSTADGLYNDPTIRRCMRLAQGWGFGSVEVVNLFAYRSPHPKMLTQVPDPVGPENDRYLLAAVKQAEQVIVAWGNWGCLFERDRAVLRLLAGRSPLFCLGNNRSGQPRHPLYVRREVAIVPFER